MDAHTEWQELVEDLKIFCIWSISSLADAAFLVVWALVQWLVNDRAIARFQLSGIDRLVLEAFQLLFAVSTLTPVAIYIYVDIRVMFLRARRRIREERGA